MKDKVKALDVARDMGLYLKIVVSVCTCQNYNSFFNIYDEFEEPCRRIVVLTPFESLEEVIDKEPDKPIKKFEMIHGNFWIEEYPLTKKVEDINLDEIYISYSSKEKIEDESNKLNKRNGS